ncbi:PspA/IM30 family protein [Robertmurraya sp. DFI.2.37]|uniref:PspA/IM30 family protein n=1 Tax=Robertmurraya sp. DFI.2.37 TaxID=3031819 RepID=UPI0012453375|nr:PspA/IM30 family protein [Robertmurraya sp. DFI.2.37]MDF1509608.1 PspA/IM30 family protein [Robertmurraya sp. DFI.2.37]
MTNLFTRIKNTVMADLNEVLEQKEKKNPIAMLNQYLRQCEQETEKVRKLIARQYQLREEFANEYEKSAELAQKRKQQAEIAEKAGETELQQFAAKEAIHHEERASRLHQALNDAAAELQKLEEKYEVMKHKLKDMHIRRMELMGRENVTRANHKMDQVINENALADKSASRFGEIESYLERLEKDINHSYQENMIDARIAELEKKMKTDEKSANF